MRFPICFVVISSAFSIGLAQQHPAMETKPVSFLAGLGSHHHPISTTNPEAQKFFDQGLLLAFNFNHEEAVRSFERAAELDPKAPMPHWGISYALGANINDPGSRERMMAAAAAIQKALSLAPNGTEHERGYIKAMATRYSADSTADMNKLAVDYKNAMAELVKRYPDDLDAASIYADAIMNLRPWKFWTLDGKPAEGTEEIIAVLESVLRRNSNHIYANHLYIHAVEASPNPERGLASANRLGKLTPASGHLVHMPFHIYMRVGDYTAAAASNAEAMKADKAFIEQTGTHQTMYAMMYYGHNMHSLAASSAMDGRFNEAKRAADQLYAHVSPHVKDIPFLELFTPAPAFVLLRFHRWNDILKLQEPEATMPVTRTLYHYARGVAYVMTGKLKDAQKEQRAFASSQQQVSPDAPFGLNAAKDVLNVASVILSARIEQAKGNRKGAIELWRNAVAVQDLLSYDEPSSWYYPVRESLGAALMADGRYEEAEKVFREDLDRTPRNARSLLGLYESLKAQKKTVDAELVYMQFQDAWKNADTSFRVQEM